MDGLAFQLPRPFRRRAGAAAGSRPVAGVDSGFLDMLHDSSDMHGSALTQRIDIHLNRTGQIAVEQNRAVAPRRCTAVVI